MRKAQVFLMVLVLGLVFNSADADLVAHYEFEGDANDSVGTNHGTVFGAEYTGGQIGSALSFDGLDDYVDLGNDPSLKPTFPLTVSAWINASNLEKISYILGLDDQSSNYYGISFFVRGPEHFNKLATSYGDGGHPSSVNRRSKIGNTTLLADTWYHVTAVIRGATDMDLYINGDNDGGWYDGTGGSLAYSNGNSHVATGGYAVVPHNFNGVIDDVRIYNHALSGEEVRQLYLDGTMGAREIAIIRIENALEQKVQALEMIAAALEKEWSAYEILEEMLESGDYGDLKKGDIVKSIQKIHSAIQHQEQSVDTIEKSIKKLEDALRTLGWQPQPDPDLVTH